MFEIEIKKGARRLPFVALYFFALFVGGGDRCEIVFRVKQFGARGANCVFVARLFRDGERVRRPINPILGGQGGRLRAEANDVVHGLNPFLLLDGAGVTPAPFGVR